MDWRRGVGALLALVLPCVGSALGAQDARARVNEALAQARRDSARQVPPRASVPPGRATRLAALGDATVARRTYQYRAADALYGALVPAPLARPDDIGVLAMLGWAQALMTRWRMPEARALLERAAAASAQLGDATSEGEALALLAGLIARQGGLDSARSLMDRAGTLVPAATALNALRLCSYGGIVRGQSLARADSLVQAGLAIARATADSTAMGRCLVILGSVLEGRGRVADADPPIREAITLLSAVRDLDALGSAQQWLAYTLVQYAQDFGTGRLSAERAILNGKRAGNPQVVAWARLNLAQAALRVGDAVSVLRAATEAEATFARLVDRPGELASRSLVAQALLLSGRPAEALQRYAELESLMLSIGVPNAIPVNKLRRAEALLELGRADGAAEQIDSAVSLATRHGVRGVLTSSQHYLRGMLHLRQGLHDRAIESFELFKRGVGAGAAHLNLDADMRIAEAYARSGRFAAAESVFTIGSASLDHMRTGARGREDVLRLLSGLRYDHDTDLGIATIVSALARAGRLDGAFGIAESERARWLWIRRARRQAFSSAGQRAQPLDERVLEIADIRRLLDPATAVLAYVTGRGGEPTTLFAIWQGGARSFQVPAVDSLAEALASFTASLEGGAPARVAARQLGALLLDSAVAALPASVRDLRIVPDGQLHHLPFDALELSGGQRVLQRFVVALAPSARLAVAPRAPSSRVDAVRLVAVGDPVFDSRYALPRLRASAEEAAAVVRAAGTGEVLVRQRARVGAVRGRNWNGVGILHLATHARVQDWGLLDNAIYLGASADEDGRLGSEQIAAMALGVDLVVLSACRTVGGMVATGEGVQGLVAPVLEAGARAVVVTHWAVRDRALIGLMTRFYARLARGETAAAALTAVRREALGRGESPAVWAALTLVGDGEVRPLAATAAGPPVPAPANAATSRPGGAP